MLFSNEERSDTRPASEGESHYAYLNKCAKDWANRVREVLEDWFSHYPDEGKKELGKRMRSRNNYEFISSFFELYLHELLRRLGCRVELHPELLSDNPKHPEFIVTSNDSNSFYLEAISTAMPQKEASKHTLMNSVYNVLNKFESPDFFLGMEIRGTPASAPSAKKLCSQLAQWIRTLDYDQLVDLYKKKGIHSMPRYDYKHESWNIVFFPIPKAYEARGKLGLRPIGMKSGEMQLLRIEEIIFNALKQKGTRYGALDKPYIIAVNVVQKVFAHHIDHEDVVGALFGKEPFASVCMTNGSKSSFDREFTGFFGRPSSPLHTRVSAVLITDGLDPTRIAQRNLWLYHNPWPQESYIGVLSQLSEVVFDSQTGETKIKQGTHPREIFSLPEGWPEN